MQIAFSGKLGSGKSTVCSILRDVYGYEIYSTGTVQRKVAEDMGISTLELNERMMNDPALDHVIDDAVVKLSKEKADEQIVYDSRMAWHFAENTFKVYMYVDPTVAAKRVFNADRGEVEKYTDVNDALNQLTARSIEENKRFKKIYGVDNFDYNNYHLIIDSTSATPEQIAEAITTRAKEFEVNPYEGTKMLISPYVVLPTAPFGEDDSEEVIITLKDGFHYCLKGHTKLAALQIGGANFVEATFITKADVNYNAEICNEYEIAGKFTFESKPQ